MSVYSDSRKQFMEPAIDINAKKIASSTKEIGHKRKLKSCWAYYDECSKMRGLTSLCGDPRCEGRGTGGAA